MFRRLCVGGLLLLSSAGVAAGQSCVDNGYPITVTPIGDVRVDSAFLASAARAVAHRWATPSRVRAQMPQYRRVRERVIPDVPRWADDWRPDVTHTASVVLVLRRRGRPGMSESTPRTGDRLFDDSIESIVRDPMPASPALPEVPESVPEDTLALRVSFGIEPDSLEAGVVRFAAHQEPVQLAQGSLVVDYQERRSLSIGQRTQSSVNVMEGLRLFVKYDVTLQGEVDPRSIQVLESNDRDYARAIELGLLRARYNPAMSNCKPVRITVVQRFGN